jgi:molecular chaperone HtpG
MKRVNPDMAIPQEKILELNPEHEVVQILEKTMATDPVLAKDYAAILYAQALLMAELPLEDPTAYTELVCRLMK